MKKKLTFGFLMYLVLAVALSVPCSAEAFRGKDLNLTDEQKVELKEIRTAAGDEIKLLIEELKKLMADMEEIMLSEEEIDTGEGSEASLLG